MTDLMFLLLIFMIIATTLINPNALKLVLPKSSNQLKDKAITTVSIEKKAGGYNYYVDKVVFIMSYKDRYLMTSKCKSGIDDFILGSSN